jgi:hypothetical protein
MSMMPCFEFLAVVAFIDWCATHPPHWQPSSLPEGVDPTKELQGWATQPWVARAIERFYYSILTGLVVVVVITRYGEVFDLRSGPFLLVPGYRILIALLPRYKPYGGVWDKAKEGVQKTQLPEIVSDKFGAKSGLFSSTKSDNKM